MLLVFAVASRELVASVIVAPVGMATVATFIWRQFEQGSVGLGMAMSGIAIVVTTAVPLDRHAHLETSRHFRLRPAVARRRDSGRAVGRPDLDDDPVNGPGNRRLHMPGLLIGQSHPLSRAWSRLRSERPGR